MRLTCPHCGERDLREFYYMGDAQIADRPAPDAGATVWNDYLHNRDNPCGDTRDMWQHDPCGTWLRVRRNTATHAVHDSAPAGDRP